MSFLLKMTYGELKHAHALASNMSYVRDTFVYGSQGSVYGSSCFHDKARLWNDSFLLKELLLREALVTRHSKVLELLPGTSHKVALALEAMNFSGTLTQVDLLEDRFMPTNLKFRCQRLDADAFAKNSGWSGYDLVIGNHIVDDLLVSYLIERTTFVRNYYHDDGEQASFWKRLDLKTIDRVAMTLSKQLIEKIATMDRGAWLVIRHYPSTIEMVYDQVRRIKLTMRLHFRIASILARLAGTKSRFFDLEHYQVPRFAKLQGSVFGLQRL